MANASGIRTIEEIMRFDNVGAGQAKKIQDAEILALVDKQQAKKKIEPPSPTNHSPNDKNNKQDQKQFSDIPIQRDAKGRFTKQPLPYVPKNRISSNLGLENNDVKDELFGKKSVNYITPSENVPVHLTNERLYGSQDMISTVMPQFHQFVNDLNEREEKHNLEENTKEAMRQLQQRSLFMFLSHGFIKKNDENLQKIFESLDDLLDKYQPKKSDTTEKLVSSEREIKKLLDEADKKGTSKTLPGFGDNKEVLKTLKSIEKYTIVSATILHDLIHGKTHGKDKDHKKFKNPLDAFKRKGGSIKSKDDKYSRNHYGEDEYDSSFLPALLTGELGLHLGNKIGGAVSTFATAVGQIITKTIPILAGASAVAALGYLTAKGMGDANKVQERQKDLDNLRKQETSGNKTVSQMPTNVQNLFASGEANKEQFDKLKTDDEKRKYLQSFGVNNDDIENTLKHPELATKANDNGKNYHRFEAPPPRQNHIFDPGSNQQTTFTQMSLSGDETTTTDQRSATPMPSEGPTPIPQSTPFQGSQKEFYDGIRKEIYDAAVAKGIPNPDVIADIGAAQSSLETGYGKHVVGDNYFGIKSGGGVGRGSVSAGTTEVVNGKTVGMDQNFATFNGRKDAAVGYVDFLIKNPRYKGMLQAKTKEEAITALGNSGYATDPNYRTKVASIVGRGTSSQLQASQPQPPPQIKTGEAITKANDTNNNMKAATASPTVNVNNVAPQTPVMTTAQHTPGVANVRNDDPSLLMALRGDLKMA